MFLFITANENEREAFEEKFIRQEEKYVLGKTYYVGRFGNYDAAYIHMHEQGVSSPAATSLVGNLIGTLSPVAVVMVGIAFGADEKEEKIGDVLVSDKILPYDSQKILEEKTIYKEIPKEVGFQLLNAFREHGEWVYNLPNKKKSVVHIGSVLTGSRLINNYEYREKLLDDFAEYKPVGGEMEAQGIYAMCRLQGIGEWIIVKGICDWGYKKNNPNKEADQKIAAHAAVDYCFHVFSRAGVFASLTEESQNHQVKEDKAQRNQDLRQNYTMPQMLQLYEKADELYECGDYEAALEYVEKSIKYYENIRRQSKKQWAKLYNLKLCILLKQENSSEYEAIVEKLKKHINGKMSGKDRSNYYLNMALAMRQIKPEEFQNYALMSLQDAQKYGVEELEEFYLVYTAALYDTRQYMKAYNYAKKSYEIMVSKKDVKDYTLHDKDVFFKICANIAEVAIICGEYEKNDRNKKREYFENAERKIIEVFAIENLPLDDVKKKQFYQIAVKVFTALEKFYSV